MKLVIEYNFNDHSMEKLIQSHDLLMDNIIEMLKPSLIQKFNVISFFLFIYNDPTNKI